MKNIIDNFSFNQFELRKGLAEQTVNMIDGTGAIGHVLPVIPVSTC